MYIRFNQAASIYPDTLPACLPLAYIQSGQAYILTSFLFTYLTPACEQAYPV